MHFEIKTKGKMAGVVPSGRLVSRKKVRNDFLHLHMECVSALEIYMAEADKLCQMLRDCDGDARDVSEQGSLIAQEQREHAAHAEYHRARKRLVRFAHLNDATKRRRGR
ncbi:MAG TPA: hypothetical protein VGL97_05685 [Bryobacteraceae bacterium]|jgi:hypothetical protein